MLVNIPYVGSSLLPNSTGKNTEKNIRQYWHYSTRKKMIDLCRIQRTKICGASVSNSLPSPLPLGSRKKVMENLPIFDDFPLKMKVFGVRFRKWLPRRRRRRKRKSLHSPRQVWRKRKIRQFCRCLNSRKTTSCTDTCLTKRRESGFTRLPLTKSHFKCFF